MIEVNPRLALTVQTNGGMRSPDWWAELGKRFRTANTGVYFGIDGLEDTNHLYRINVNWKRLMEHAQAFIAAGGHAGWNFIVFKHNEHQIEMARELATKMGFKHFLVKKTARFMLSLPEKNVAIPVLPVYKKDKSLSHLLEPPLNSEQKNTVLKLAEQNNLDHQIEISKELKLELKKNHHLQRNFSKQFAQTDFSQFDQTEVNCIVKRDKSLFIDCHGHVLPCCWTTWPLYSFWGDPEAYQMRQLVDEIGGMDSINAKNQTLQEIVEGPLFNKIAQGWGKASIKDGKPLICAKTCPRYLSPIPEEAARSDL
jgi:hypothetical protein